MPRFKYQSILVLAVVFSATKLVYSNEQSIENNRPQGIVGRLTDWVKPLVVLDVAAPHLNNFVSFLEETNESGLLDEDFKISKYIIWPKPLEVMDYGTQQGILTKEHIYHLEIDLPEEYILIFRGKKLFRGASKKIIWPLYFHSQGTYEFLLEVNKDQKSSYRKLKFNYSLPINYQNEALQSEHGEFIFDLNFRGFLSLETWRGSESSYSVPVISGEIFIAPKFFPRIWGSGLLAANYMFLNNQQFNLNYIGFASTNLKLGYRFDHLQQYQWAQTTRPTFYPFLSFYNQNIFQGNQNFLKIAGVNLIAVGIEARIFIPYGGLFGCYQVQYAPLQGASLSEGSVYTLQNAAIQHDLKVGRPLFGNINLFVGINNWQFWAKGRSNLEIQQTNFGYYFGIQKSE